MAAEHELVGSEGRDYAMLERNLLSHIRLAVLLSLLSSSLLLDARLPTSSDADPTPSSRANIAVSIIQVVAAVAAIAAGVWEYWQGYKDITAHRGFLSASKSHLAILSLVSLIVFATCLVLMT